MCDTQGTQKPLVPVLVDTMNKIEAVMVPCLGPYEEAMKVARHRVERNAAIAAGGLTDDQQNVVLELHRLVDLAGDNNGTVEKEEIEAAVGDKRGKFFAKLDVDADGHVDPEEFLAFFERMARARGMKAVQGLLDQIQKGVDKLRRIADEKAAREAEQDEDDEEEEDQEDEA